MTHIWAVAHRTAAHQYRLIIKIIEGGTNEILCPRTFTFLDLHVSHFPVCVIPYGSRQPKMQCLLESDRPAAACVAAQWSVHCRAAVCSTAKKATEDNKCDATQAGE